MSKVSAHTVLHLNPFGAIRRSRVYDLVVGVGCVALVAAVLAAAGASAARVPATITPSSIAGLRLGLPASAYVHALGEQGSLSRFANGTARLSFPRAQISVTLGLTGKGVAITTAAPRYLLKGGVGPCRPLTLLQRVYRPATVVVNGAFGPIAHVYRVGRLWITLRNGQMVGRVTLASKQPALAGLIAESQCGGGTGESD